MSNFIRATIVLTPRPGAVVIEAIEEAYKRAYEARCEVKLTINDIEVSIKPKS